MLAAFKIFLLLAVLNASKSESTPDPELNTSIEFLGFFGEDKYCYYKHSTIYPSAYNYSLYKMEFVVKDFSGREISRDIVKKEEIEPEYNNQGFDKLIIKTKYPNTKNIIDFLRSNKVTKNKSLHYSSISFKRNFLYCKNDIRLKKDSILILDSSQIRKLIIKYNKEPIYMEYMNTQLGQNIKLGDYEKELIFNRVSKIYEWKDKYLLILSVGESYYDYNNDAIIIVNKPLIDNILKKE